MNSNMPDSSAIIVSKENEVYLKLDAEADTRRMLSEFFSFEVPGYKFTPQLVEYILAFCLIYKNLRKKMIAF